MAKYVLMTLATKFQAQRPLDTLALKLQSSIQK